MIKTTIKSISYKTTPKFRIHHSQPRNLIKYQHQQILVKFSHFGSFSYSLYTLKVAYVYILSFDHE